MDNWLVKKFEDPNLIYVFDPTPGALNGLHRGENTARFRIFGDNPMDVGVEALCGCTILVVVSRRAVYFAHFL